MLADFSQALAAEHLPIPTPLTADQEQAAATAVACRARDKAELVQLLDALGLPTNEDTLTGLLLYLTDPTDREPTGDATPMTAQNAFEAMALSMYYADQSTAEITEATGLSEAEITALVDAQERQFDINDHTDYRDPYEADTVVLLVAVAAQG